MVKGRKIAVSPSERLKWLEELEKGRGITKIAVAAKRDIRIVKRHIEIARQDRVADQVRHDFLLSRLEQHQQNLLDEVKRIRKVITRFPPRDLEPSDPIQQRVHEALMEHIKRLSAGKALQAYAHFVQEYSNAHGEISQALADKKETLVGSLSEEVDLYDWVLRLMDMLEEVGPSERSYRKGKSEDGTYKPSWGEFNLTRSSVTKANLHSVLKAHQDLVSQSEQYRPGLQEHRQRVLEAANQVAREMDVFTMKGLVLGRCQYCPL